MGYYKVCHPIHNRDSRSRKRKGIKIIFKESMAEHFPTKEGKKYPGTESTVGPKWGETSQTHSKT